MTKRYSALLAALFSSLLLSQVPLTPTVSTMWSNAAH
jgi:hypothetical protein